MTEQLPFNGIMNLDDNNNVFPAACHKHARNIRFMGNAGNFRAENIAGTREVLYPLPAGVNECVGSYYDSLRQRTIWFNRNGNGQHGIYQMRNNIVTAITVCGAVDYLNFTSDIIHSINIVYGDETLGDILYFVDSLKRPTKINITRALAGGYGVMQRSYLDVAKEPPLLPPTVAFGDDPTATVNSFRKSLYQFKYRFVYDDNEKSVWSSISEVPIPSNYLDPANDSNPTSNALITVGVKTGEANVKKVELAARQNIENSTGDFYLLTTIDKAALTLGNNADFTYTFKGNTARDYILLNESTLLFDYVPKEANTQELLNGNIIIYGGIKEGCDFKETVKVDFHSDTVAIPQNDFAVTPIYNFWSSYKFGLVYYDEKGRTNGVVTTDDFQVSTIFNNGRVPQITARIWHRPPVWAKTYQWVRTNNLTVSKFLYWVSNETYKDEKFAYIGIQNLYTEDKDKQTVLTYDYAPGDRIRFVNFIDKEYIIDDFLTSPEIDGIVRTGTFIRIKLPFTDTTFDFGTKYGNHLIELYTPAATVDKSLNTYYEFGEAYTIGFPGLASRYHRGQTNQSADLVVPATFVFTKGDVYRKLRTVTTGGYAKFSVHSGDAWTSAMLVGVDIENQVTTNETYEFNTTPFIPRNQINTFFEEQTGWIIKTIGDKYTFGMKGSIKVSSTAPTVYRLYLMFSDGSILGGVQGTEVDIIPNTALVTGDNTLEFDVTFTVPANTRAFLFTDNSTSQTLHYYVTKFTIGNTTLVTKPVVDANFADNFLSAVNSNGRPLVVDATGETYNPSLIRWSEAYQAGTNINNISRFYPLNFDELDRAKGDIRRFKVRANLMHVFQSRGCGSIPIFQQILDNADGSTNLMQSDKIINKIRYYQGEFGIADQPASLASSPGADYFSDTVRGYQCRLAGDGVTPISELYKAQYYMPPVLKNYMTDAYYNEAGSRSKLIGCYDYSAEEFLTVFQKCSEVYAGDTLGFSEPRNAYTSFYDFDCEQIICAENTLVSWKEGKLFVHDSPLRNTFYGKFYPAIIDRVVNVSANVKKEFLSLGYHSDSAWDCPTITTSMNQLTNLIDGDFEWRESMFTAALLRDINSVGGLIDGDFIKGVWMQLRLKNDLNSYQMLYGLYVNYLISQKNF